MLYFSDHVTGVLKENSQSHIEDFVGFETDHYGSLEDGKCTVRLSIHRDLYATINSPDGDYCMRKIRRLPPNEGVC
uniref:Uncharacterized protein n=1 Tax=Ditylenchus dipsaci TaxID=166011 RepID=A0A915D1Y8_9BILA